ncbi:hypothetical protein J6590_102152 [Homalodisca vitripennis]|nr:hypothetical protein J6590_102152 [Homalodisca vitripennis]
MDVPALNQFTFESAVQGNVENIEAGSVLKSMTVSPQVLAWTNCPTLQKSDVSHPRQTRRGPTVLQSRSMAIN